MESGEMDLLSKQAILSLPRDVEKSLDGKILDEYIKVKYIEALPTVQPEERTEKRMETHGVCLDAISRQVAVDVLHGYFDGMLDTDTVCPADIYGLFECIPSAQPETAKRIVGKERDGMTLWYQCDMCNEPVDEQDNYCRGCGRRLIDG